MRRKLLTSSLLTWPDCSTSQSCDALGCAVQGTSCGQTWVAKTRGSWNVPECTDVVSAFTIQCSNSIQFKSSLPPRGGFDFVSQAGAVRCGSQLGARPCPAGTAGRSARRGAPAPGVSPASRPSCSLARCTCVRRGEGRGDHIYSCHTTEKTSGSACMSCLADLHPSPLPTSSFLHRCV